MLIALKPESRLVPDDKSRLRTQRIVIVLAVLVALAFAGGNIVNSMRTWQDNEAATTAAD